MHIINTINILIPSIAAAFGAYVAASGPLWGVAVMAATGFISGYLIQMILSDIAEIMADS